MTYAIRRVLVLCLALACAAAGQYSAYAQTSCSITTDETLQVPIGTTHVYLYWTAATTSCYATDGYFRDGSKETYETTGQSPSWSLTVLGPDGSTLTKQQGVIAISETTLGCNPYLNHCPPPPPCPQNTPPVTGQQYIDVTTLTAQHDVTLTLRVTKTSAIAKTTHIDPLGNRQVGPTCHYGPALASGFGRPDINIPEILWTDSRMLAHLPESDLPSSRFQRQSDDVFGNLPLGNRPQFLLTFNVVNMKPNDPIWLRVIDPPDPSAYSALARASDNEDTSGGVLYALNGGQATIGLPLQVVPDPDTHNVQVVLEGTNSAIGDNYQIIGSVDPPGANGAFPCEAYGNCPKTAVITVWKRLYYEVAKMAKQGAFLADNVTPSPNCGPTSNPCLISLRSVAINGVDFVTPGATLTLIGTGGTANMGSVSHISETVTVAQDEPGFPAVQPILGTNNFSVRLTSSPQHSYEGGASRFTTMYDAVVIPSAGTWDLDASAATALLAESFIEYAPTPGGSAVVPYVGMINISDAVHLKRWFLNIDDPSQGFKPLPNQRYLLAAGSALVTPACGTQLGDRIYPMRFSLVYENSIHGLASGTEGSFLPTSNVRSQPETLPSGCVGVTINNVFNRAAADLEVSAVAHEASHQFSVNHSNGGTPLNPQEDGSGHCIGRQAYDNPGYVCLMDSRFPQSAPAQQLIDRSFHFHWISGTPPNSEYSTLRDEPYPWN